ncbi:MFS transporter [Nocardia sp. NPDC127579]|uniref:MFS transporter n=1 Tax=Nocardia sp. NPDC127579 TaxID=3345402 RepID=UPI0036267AA1
MSTTTDEVRTSTAEQRRIGVAAACGSFMEWFDFAVYGFFAVTIGQLFFPSDDPATELLLSLSAFGVALVMRPLGGVVFGIVGDRLGRRASLTGSVVLMAVSTTLIALLPTYASIGVLAPIVLVVLRMLQGASVGGEWAGAAAFLVEQAPQHRRALAGSVVPATAGAGGLGGVAVALLLTNVLSENHMLDWGWRVPFLLAAPLGLAAVYIRLKLEDTPIFTAMQAEGDLAQAPTREALRHNRRAIALCFFATASATVGYYYLVTSTPNTLMSDEVGTSRMSALSATGAILAVYTALCPVAGIISDRIGRRPTILLGAAGLMLFSVPAFWLLNSGNIVIAVLAMSVFALFEAMVNVTMVVLLIELFPARTRMTGCSLGFNLAGALLGGPAAVIVAASATGFEFSGAGGFYMTAVATMTLAGLYFLLPETKGRDLHSQAEATWETRSPASVTD